jgi:hypothetical protein
MLSKCYVMLLQCCERGVLCHEHKQPQISEFSDALAVGVSDVPWGKEVE